MATSENISATELEPGDRLRVDKSEGRELRAIVTSVGPCEYDPKDVAVSLRYVYDDAEKVDIPSEENLIGNDSGRGDLGKPGIDWELLDRL